MKKFAGLRGTRIVSVLFFALLGSILSAFIGIAPIIGALALQACNFIPYTPGILGVNTPGGEGTSVAEDAIIEKVKGLIDGYKSDLKRGMVSEEVLSIRLKEITDKLETMPKSLDPLKSEIMDILKKQGEAITSLKEMRAGKDGSNEISAKAAYKESIEEYLKSDNVKKLSEGKSFSSPKQLLKSTTNLTTNYTGTTVQLTDNRDKNIYRNPIFKVFLGDVINYLGITKQRDYRYTQESDFTDNIPNLSENTDSTELAFTLVEATETAKRVAAHIPVSKWMLRSVDQCSSYLMERLPEALKANFNFQMLYGSGSGSEMKGLFKHASAINLADKSYSAGAISSVATYDSGSKVIITFAAAHGLYGGETLTIANSSNYNGSYTVTKKTKTQIMITVAYNAESTSAWTGTSVNPFKANVVSASKLDALVCAVAQYNGQELLTATAILVNPIDYYSMLFLNKATTAEIINPNYVLTDVGGVKYLNGVAILPVDKVTAGEFLIGDFQRGVSWLDYADGEMGGETIEIIEDTTTKKSNSVMVFIERDVIMPVFNAVAFQKGVFATIISYINKT